MKKCVAAFSLVILLFLSGCEKGFSDYTSDLNRFFEEKVLSEIKSYDINNGEIVNITPEDEVTGNAQLSSYNKLSDNQKKLYSIIHKAVEDMELRLIDVTKCSNSDIFSDAIAAHRALMFDRPDIFWMPKVLSFVSVEGKKNKYICFKEYSDKQDTVGFYGMTLSQKLEMSSKLIDAEKTVTSKLNQFDNDFDKELFIHDYLCEHIEYDNSAASDLKNANVNSTTVYGALVEGKAICEGYSKAMQYLCLKSGIPCSIVCGEHENTPHMWNIINPGDGLYYLDVTFDDSSDTSVLHSYFNLTKAEISEDHSFAKEFLPEASYDVSDNFNFFCGNYKNTQLNFFEKNSAYITDDYRDAIIFITSQYDKGKTSAELKNLTSLTNREVFDALSLKLRGAVNLKKSYGYEGKNIIILVW